jgi:hypothetical protein
VTDDDWRRRRDRAISAAFQTGRAVYADADRELRYADGDHEPLPDDVGAPRAPLPDAKVRLTWWARIRRAFRRKTS